MEDFKGYLIKKSFVPNTAESYRWFIEKKFYPWLHENAINIDTLEHGNLMWYIRHRKA